MDNGGALLTARCPLFVRGCRNIAREQIIHDRTKRVVLLFMAFYNNYAWKS